nr:hypothetical protein [Tanacetum cinerariifolium]
LRRRPGPGPPGLAGLRGAGRGRGGRARLRPWVAAVAGRAGRP